MLLHRIPRPAQGAARGFTLIELMIATVVVALLAVVAVPAFNDAIRKSRRSEGIAALMAVQQAQERWRANNASYAPSVSAAPNADPPGLGLPATTANGYYEVAMAAANATGYTATATAVAGTTQAADEQCRTLGVRMQGGNLSYAGCGGQACGFAATNACWAR